MSPCEFDRSASCRGHGGFSDEQEGTGTVIGNGMEGAERDQPCNGRRGDGSKLSAGEADLEAIQAGCSGMLTTTSSMMKDWQATTNPEALSSSVSCMSDLHATEPRVIWTRHFPQVPFPPQGSSIMIPARPAASMSKVPEGTSMVFPMGRKVIFGI